VTTTNQNYNQHLSGIPLSSLSQKFKDAIEITRFLKQRFLWIDSLCIIQPGTDKDMTDWEREASKMADVYQKSWLTIASAGSGDNLAGCVDPYDPSREHIISPDHISLGMLATPPPPFTFMTANGAGVLAREGTSAQISANGWGMITITEEWMPSSFKSQPMTYSIGCFGQKVDVLGDDPLSHRGWTLQERALSPRTLHLSRNQLFFECTRGITSEDGSRLPSGPFPLDVVIDKQLLPASEYGLGGDHVDTIVAHGTIQGGQHVGIPIEGFPPPGGVFGRWDGGWLAVVQNFSNRMLSESKDKLPALSGFARAINAWTGEEYLAGLWRDHIFEDLNWMVLEREEHTMMLPGRFGFEYGKKFRTPVNPQDYRAPSWSWASLDASVEFVPLDYTRIVAILVDVHINRSQTDPFGQVGMGCRIHLEVRRFHYSLAACLHY
jgi:hypothetical protein